MKSIQILDKVFEMYLPSEKIQKRVTELSGLLSRDYRDTLPIFVGILNGSFMFASDLLKSITMENMVTFMKLASYEGTASSGDVKKLIGLNENLKGRDVVILEDIVDTGNTIKEVIRQVSEFNPKSIKVVTLLLKSDVYSGEMPLEYVGFDIPDRFVVGYGLDYEGLGRNLPDIYKLID